MNIAAPNFKMMSLEQSTKKILDESLFAYHDRRQSQRVESPKKFQKYSKNKKKSQYNIKHKDPAILGSYIIKAHKKCLARESFGKKSDAILQPLNKSSNIDAFCSADEVNSQPDPRKMYSSGISKNEKL